MLLPLFIIIIMAQFIVKNMQRTFDLHFLKTSRNTATTLHLFALNAYIYCCASLASQTQNWEDNACLI